MMAQYRRIKAELPRDALLLFRLGDFYEMFFEDAQLGARLLNLTLTARQGVPMCGLPYHAAAGYIARLLRAGHKVALCDQLEEAKPGKLVPRQVTQILSPGAHLDERMLAAERPNYLAAIAPGGARFGLALVDLTTGDFRVTELESAAALLAELERTRPAEVVLPAEAAAQRQIVQGVRATFTAYEDWAFAPETAQFTVREHFGVAALDGFGLRGRTLAIGAAGAALHYLGQHLRRDLRHLTRLTFYQAADFLVLDAATLRNLEVLEPLQRDAPRTASLYGALNRTLTPMGARRLRDWLSQPLASVPAIRRRQDAVEALVRAPAALEALRAALQPVRDLERTLARLSVGTGNARDLVALGLALQQVPPVREAVRSVLAAAAMLRDGPAELPPLAEPRPPEVDAPPPLLAELAARLADCPELVALIGRALVEDPPLALKEGGLIRDGFDPALDELRQAMRGGKEWIARLQRDEIARTGIPSLKVGFNAVFGYYIEVTRTHLDKVPPDYLRKQTIANGERFITPALKEMEARILGAEERAARLEYELFLRVREAALACLHPIQQTAAALGELDVLAALAEQARLYNYCRPEVGDAGLIRIREGRHPVLELALTEERFVPNDTELAAAARDGEDPPPVGGAAPEASAIPQIALITGPNMAGKSTYIRQVALLVLLAHTGSFVPARAARVDLVDRIFTRIGASDDLARGQSTFMVEMTETANILNNATARSLIILDEVGRGTSTFDGLSLAWSIVEYLHHQVGARTLFATHYHELTELAAKLPRVRNYNVAVREWNEQIIFLRQIVPGGTDKSYGLHVARLAGVPRAVIERAKVILRNLEAAELTPEGQRRRPAARLRAEREALQALEPPAQLDLFG